MSVMVSGIAFAVVCTAVVAAILGSIVLHQYVMTIGHGSIVTPLEQKCMDVARQGHAIQSAYPGMTLDEIPLDDARSMIRLDEIWMDECVAKLPLGVVMDIADRVTHDVPSRGE